MAFSPPPWDMLAWAEDHGRIGVADIRQMFVRRQIISLDKEKNVTVDVEDTTPRMYRNLPIKERLKQQHLARLRSMRGMPGDSLRTDNLLEETRADWMQRRQRRQDLMSYHRGLDLDPRERSVLDALETTMDDVEHHPQPYSVNYTSPPRFRPSHLADPNSGGDLDARFTPILRASNPLMGHRSYRPQRRTSVILSDSTVNRHLVPIESPRARLSASPGRITDDEDMPPMSTNDLTPARGETSSRPRSSDIPTSDPWHVIQSALETARRTDETATSSNGHPTLAQIEAALEAERRLRNQLERQLSDELQLSNLLRRQIEAQDRILQSQQRELEAATEADPQLEPSIERLLHRELASEQQFGEQRSRDLEEEIQSGVNRARRLESVRSRLLRNLPQNLDTTSSSAQTSALPTFSTLSQQPEATDAADAADTTSPPSPDSLSATLHRHEAFRRQRAAHIENLERQVRRAESRVASASSDIQDLENAIQRGASSERLVRQHEARVRAASMSASGQTIPRDQPRARLIGTAFRDAERPSRTTTTASTTGGGSRTVTELAGRASESELRLARMMFLSGGSRNMDANGNWVAGGGLQRMLAQASAGASSSRAGPSASVADVVREMGVGTAGIGWSGDGRSL